MQVLFKVLLKSSSGCVLVFSLCLFWFRCLVCKKQTNKKTFFCVCNFSRFVIVIHDVFLAAGSSAHWRRKVPWDVLHLWYSLWTWAFWTALSKRNWQGNTVLFQKCYSLKISWEKMKHQLTCFKMTWLIMSFWFIGLPRNTCTVYLTTKCKWIVSVVLSLWYPILQ